MRVAASIQQGLGVVAPSPNQSKAMHITNAATRLMTAPRTYGPDGDAD
jgi:hypothetical protein